MASLHGLQAESEIFRRAQCQEMEEEADYEEYQRRMRAAAKSKAPPPRSRVSSKRQEPAAAAISHSVQEVLEGEHQERIEARARLEEREQRLDAVVSAQLTGQSVQTTSATVTVDELRDELRDNARAMQSDAIEFVGSYGK